MCRLLWCDPGIVFDFGFDKMFSAAIFYFVSQKMARILAFCLNKLFSHFLPHSP